MSEIWKSVPGYEGLYQVSDLGRVKGLHTQIMKTPTDARGYSKVNLSKNKVKVQKSVHSLVASAFLGPRPEGYDINHKNGDKTDNRAENLEYTTRQQNLRHAIFVGLTPVGSQRSQAKLTAENVREIRSRLAQGETHKSIAQSFGVSRRAVTFINTGKTYKKEAV